MKIQRRRKEHWRARDGIASRHVARASCHVYVGPFNVHTDVPAQRHALRPVINKLRNIYSTRPAQPTPPQALSRAHGERLLVLVPQLFLHATLESPSNIRISGASSFNTKYSKYYIVEIGLTCTIKVSSNSIKELLCIYLAR